LGDLFVNSVLNPRWVSSVRKTGRNLLAQMGFAIMIIGCEIFFWLLLSMAAETRNLPKTKLVRISNDGMIRLWDVQRGLLIRTLKGHTNIVFSLAFSAEGQALVSGSSDQTIKIWDTATGNCTQNLPQRNRIFPIALSPLTREPPSTQLIASPTDNFHVQLRGLASGEQIQEFPCGNDLVYSLAFSPDGTCLACGSGDRTITLWDTQTGECLQTLQGHQGTIWAISFDAAGQTLASASFKRFGSGISQQGSVCKP
jgi:WD40 repeat protein